MSAVDNIRLPQQSKEQLIRLKRITGIEHWNTLCRWAFCLSLAEESSPPEGKVVADSSLEMSWRTFAGDFSDVYHALLIQRAHDEGKAITRESLSDLLRTHIVRGVGFLTARRDLGGVNDLIGLIEAK